jgi:hypothetical protein
MEESSVILIGFIRNSALVTHCLKGNIPYPGEKILLSREELLWLI